MFYVRLCRLTIATEREALLWVQKYISAFGGDPTKVMMYAFLKPFRLPLLYLTSYSQLGRERRRHIRCYADVDKWR